MENVYEHIDDYVNGLLEGEALMAFERELEENASLRLAVENYDVARDISEGLLEVDMMETLRGLKEKRGLVSGMSENNEGASIRDSGGTETRLEVKTNRFSLKKWIAAASFIGVIVFAGWWVMEWNEEEKVYAEIIDKIEWPEDYDKTKSVDTIGMTDFEKGKHYFELARYNVSLPFLEKHIMEEKDKQLLSEGYEWLGAVYIKLGKLDRAKNALEKSLEEKAKRNYMLLNSSSDRK